MTEQVLDFLTRTPLWTHMFVCAPLRMGASWRRALYLFITNSSFIDNSRSKWLGRWHTVDENFANSEKSLIVALIRTTYFVFKHSVEKSRGLRIARSISPAQTGKRAGNFSHLMHANNRNDVPNYSRKSHEGITSRIDTADGWCHPREEWNEAIGACETFSVNVNCPLFWLKWLKTHRFFLVLLFHSHFCNRNI